MDKGNVVMVLDVVVKSCSVKKDIPVTQIKRYFEKNNLVCRGGYSSGGGGGGCREMQLGDAKLGDKGDEGREPSPLGMPTCRKISCVGG
jgi:hypothetical protein